MRPGQQNKRMRGRNRKGPNPLTRSFESNGGDVKIRGTALHIAEKYVQLSRDASSSGDRVAAENYLQHAEHYYRILAAAQAQMPQPQPVVRNDDDGDGDGDEEGDGSRQQQWLRPAAAAGSQYGGEQPGFNPGDPQPYVNGNGRDDDQPFEATSSRRTTAAATTATAAASAAGAGGGRSATARAASAATREPAARRAARRQEAAPAERRLRPRTRSPPSSASASRSDRRDRGAGGEFAAVRHPQVDAAVQVAVGLQQADAAASGRAPPSPD